MNSTSALWYSNVFVAFPNFRCAKTISVLRGVKHSQESHNSYDNSVKRLITLFAILIL